MDTEQHIRQGQHNEATSEYLAGTPYNDWRCTILFYAALHYIQAYFVAKTPPQRFGTHTSRDNAIQLDSGINAIYRSYRSLKDSIRFARYEGWNPTDEQMNREIKLALAGIKEHVRRFILQIPLP